MSKTISHISQLPAWFKLEKYDSAKELNAAGWYIQLRRRAIFSHLHERLKLEGKVNLEKRNKAIEQIQNEGVIKGALNDFENDLKPVYTGLPVEELDVYGLLMLTKMLPSSMNLGEKELVKRVLNGDWESIPDSECLALMNPLSKYVCDDGHHINWFNVYLKLDMGLPDNLLIQQFTSWLRDKRANPEPNKIINPVKRKPDMDGWVKAGVLAYIDLTHWAKSQDAHITNRCMADAIFPHGEGGEEIVRKTTKVIAEQLLDWRMAHYLYILSQGEEME